MKYIARFQEQLAESYVEFSQKAGSSVVTVTAHFRGLNPGDHACHIHTYGDLKSPGKHFDPLQTKRHGLAEDENTHAGDLGNVRNGTVEFRTSKISLHTTHPACVLGRSVVVHDEADLGTQHGRAGFGEMVGVAVIGIKGRESRK
jgi:Cu/Zn superoxide dismutase